MFANIIKKIRIDKNLSQQQFAELFNSNQRQISKWENNIIEPNLLQLKQIADILQVSTDELLGRENYTTGNVEIIGEKLSSDEQKIIDIIRDLSKEQQQIAIQILQAAFPETKKGVKKWNA